MASLLVPKRELVVIHCIVDVIDLVQTVVVKIEAGERLLQRNRTDDDVDGDVNRTARTVEDGNCEGAYSMGGRE